MTETGHATERATPISAAERAEMIRLYVRQGLAVRAVAAATSRGYHSVWLTLRKANVVMRSQGGRLPPDAEPAALPVYPRPARPRRPVTADERAVMVRMYGEGNTIAEIAVALKRGTSTVWNALDAAGVERRRPGPPILTRHWCGQASRHEPHKGCNGFGLWAGAPGELCPLAHRHLPHRSCDGRGAVT